MTHRKYVYLTSVSQTFKNIDMMEFSRKKEDDNRSFKAEEPESRAGTNFCGLPRPGSHSSEVAQSEEGDSDSGSRSLQSRHAVISADCLPRSLVPARYFLLFGAIHKQEHRSQCEGGEEMMGAVVNGDQE